MFFDFYIPIISS